MKSKLNGMLTLFLAFMVQTIVAQKTVTGKVSDSSGVLPGVSVVIKGAKTGTDTDFNGNYTIKAKDTDILVFRYLGFKTVEKLVGSESEINVTLEEDSSVLEEVVVVAYGTTTKEAFTGSASFISAEQLQNRNVTSPIAAIEGRTTGVQFTSTNGQPGSTPSVVIRGVGTLNGSTNPLFIVDGIQYEGNLNTINQEDIASFTILKDAASTSLYGARAANGVVIITTKSGKKGDIKVSATVQGGIVARANPLYDQVSPQQYYEVMWEALKNSSAGAGSGTFATNNIYSQLGYNPFNVPNDQIVDINGNINPNAQLIYQTLDWFDFMEQTGVRKNYNVNVSSGSENSRVFFSASYLEEQGYVVTSNYDRFTARLNADFDVKKWLKMGGSANITVAETTGPRSAGTGSIVNPFGFAQSLGSIYPVYVNDLQGNLVLDTQGNPVFDNGEGFPLYNIGRRPLGQGRHPLQELLLNQDLDKDNTYGFRMYADMKIFDGLNFRLNYGRDFNEDIRQDYENAIIGDAQPTGRFGETRSRREVQNFVQLLTYNKSFGNHNLDITLGHESYNRLFSFNDGLATIQATTGIFEFANFSNPVSLGGASSRKAIEGYFARANYDFDGKYYLSASFRRDASSVFSKESRWGNFYSVGASWNIHKEKFMEDVSFINKLKIRSSYGEVGNDDLNDFFLSQPRFALNSNAADGAFLLSALGNTQLVWETIENFDIALEFGLFNNFLEGSFEYYKRNSTDLLYNVPLALSVGLNEQPDNIADMYNSGLEMALTAHLFNKNDFKWDLELQASTFKNEITSIPDPFINGSKRWAEGRSRFDFFLFRSAGVDPTNGDQLYFLVAPDPVTGENEIVLDANGVPQTTTDWRLSERTYTGDSSIPDLLGSVSNSFSYKGLTLDFLITYGIGGKVLDNGYSSMMHTGRFGASMHPDILRAWKNPGDNTDVPRLENGSVTQVITNLDRFLTDASFWSLKNISIGYNFERNILEKLDIDNLRLSLTGENLYLSSKRNGLDPQFNIAGTPSGNDFNPARIISLGVNVSF
ncbi:MAG: SusC/RagA family TonB-linked outer membrane protein [Polaribacter sp.]|uniref:SusC/RagA family TonB-linked outer membrane protein n=1 Tax=Polaribacter sp. TaxID=1920175 RepID=UPI003BAFFF80